MGLASGILTFLVIWWIVIFMVLPWGLKRDERGIPQNLNIKKKVLTVTVVSIVVWIVI